MQLQSHLSNILLLIASVFNFSYDKDKIHFYLCFQTFLCILTITSSRYFVYMRPGKMENSTFSTQICLRNGFWHSGFGISTSKIPCVQIFSQNKQLSIFRPITCNNLVLITLRVLQRAGWRLKWTRWSWVELGGLFSNTLLKFVG